MCPPDKSGGNLFNNELPLGFSQWNKNTNGFIGFSQK